MPNGLWLLAWSIACATPSRPITQPAHATSTPCPRPPADEPVATPPPSAGGRYDFSNDTIDGDLLCPEGADAPTASECEEAKQRVRERDARGCDAR